MADQTKLQKLFTDKGFYDFRWIEPREIVVGRWVRMKYLFGCDSYGSAATPADMPGLDECRAFFDEYHLGTLFHLTQSFDDLEERHQWSRNANRALVELEQEICAGGYYKALMIFMEKCNLCRECATGRAGCRNKKLARTSPEGLGVDIVATVAKYGYSPAVFEENERSLDRYAILLIE